MKVRDPTIVVGKLFGRNDVLDWLDRAVFASDYNTDQADCPLILLHGVRGMGKSTLCKTFVETHLAKSPNTSPILVFEWKGGIHGRSPLRFSKLLFQMARTNLPAAGPMEELLLGEGKIGHAHAELIARHDQTYQEDGLPDESFSPEQAMSERGLAALAREFVLRIPSCIGHERDDSQTHSLAKVLFVFDNFENYHALIRQWVGRYLYPRIKSSSGLFGSAFLFTGERPWDECEFADYWEVSPGSLMEYRLDPLSPGDCKQWLLSAGLSEELLEVLIEETEGSPGRVASLIAQPEKLRALHLEGNLDGHLGDYTAKQRRWLHAASMKEVVSLELFEIILGRVEAGSAMDWLRQNSNICQVWQRQDGMIMIKLDSDLRGRILELAAEKIPMRHDEYLSRLQVMDELSKKVPLREHRKCLRLLSPIKPLSEEAIRYVYEED